MRLKYMAVFAAVELRSRFTKWPFPLSVRCVRCLLKPHRTEVSCGRGVYFQVAFREVEDCKRLCYSSFMHEGARVLELGCGGSGLVGIAAAACGANCVLTDLPPVLVATAVATKANTELIRASGGSMTVLPLDWAECAAGEDMRTAAAAAAWLLDGQGPWAAVEALCSEKGGSRIADYVHCTGDHVRGPKLLTESSQGGQHQQQPGCSWVLGADLVYSGLQVKELVGLLSAIRQAAHRILAGVEQVHSSSRQAGRCGNRAAACKFLMAHKNRNEATSALMLRCLGERGFEVQNVTGAVDQIKWPSLQMFECRLW